VPRTCPFCGNRAYSREHAWPDWLKNILSEQSVKHKVKGPDGLLREWAAAPFSTTTKAVCHKCNTGWMSRLERKSKPILTPLLHGQPYALSLDDQKIVAAWCLKTAAMLDRSLGEPDTVYVPHLRRLMLDGVPPSVVRVALGTYPAMLHIARFHRTGTAKVNVRTPEGGVEEGQFYGLTFAVGRFVAQVSGHTLKRHAIDLESTALDKYLLSIWPAETVPITGPPPTLPEGGFGILANAFREQDKRGTDRTEP
jgi:hypothetical protein